MSTPMLATKLYIPTPRQNAVLRPRLIERLNEGLYRKLTLISAPAGFGKTTLLATWLASLSSQFSVLSSELASRPQLRTQNSKLNTAVAWLSLDEGDSHPTRFLAYLVAALQTVAPNVGAGVLAVLASPQPPPAEALLTALLNEITTIPNTIVLVLDDYHVIDAKPVDQAITFLLEHLPPQLRLLIATREDPQLPLARLRARAQLTELRVADMRFTPAEAAGFLNQSMGLDLSAENIAALERRTEGWVAGLQLAAISLQGHQDASSFIRSFTGSHHFVLDYLVEEVLHRQPERVQAFLLRTSILERMCGPLCDAVLDEGQKTEDDSSASFVLRPSSFVLEELERANLFIVPLDNERRWYRYHQLFADLLRQRLHQSATASPADEQSVLAELHIRASQWYEDNRLEVEAFHHAVAANDIERAARLVEGSGMPLIFRGAAGPVLHWLASLPAAALDARPALWVIYASALLFASQIASVEPKLQAAEAALQNAEPDDRTRDLIGHIAAIRATLAVSQHDVETIIAQSRCALEYLHPDNLPVRTATTWTLGYAYHLQGERAAASQAYTEAITISKAIGHFIITIMATIGLGNMQEADNQLYLAAQTYRSVLQLAGDPPLPIACEAHLGLARICYEWNDLDAAQQHGLQSLQLARQLENTDRSVASEVLLAHLKLAQGDAAGAAARLAQADQLARQHHFVHRMPEVAAAQVLVLLHQGNLAAAAALAQRQEIPLSQARVYLAQEDLPAALAVFGPLRQQIEARGWQDERLKVIVLQAVAFQAHSEKEQAVQLLGEALALAQPGGFIRIFVDEGIPMAQLLSKAAARGIMPGYVEMLLAAFPKPDKETRRQGDKVIDRASVSPVSWSPCLLVSQSLVEPLSQRELHILQLIAQGLSNHEISERLFLALSTVKGHNRNIFGKLQVQRRTEAVARARQLGLL